MKIPVENVAFGLDIYEIKFGPHESFEGALLTTPERNTDSIVINNASVPERQRFTLAHELGHFLNLWHTPTNSNGFMCGKKDIQVGGYVVKPGLTQHEVQELEANRFAIELLAPRSLIERLSRDEPSMHDVLSIASTLELSKAAAARRYAALHPGRMAVVFTRAGLVEYSIASLDCPKLLLRKGDRLIRPHSLAQKEPVPSEIDIGVRRGLNGSRDITAYAETLFQQCGYAVTLLYFGTDEDDEDT